MSEKTIDIYQAMNAVMAQVGYVQKQRAKQLNYSYAGEAALIGAIRPHLVEHGIIIHPAGVEQIHQDQYTTRSGAVMNRSTVSMVYRFAHASSGTFIDVPVVGEGADVGDKSATKAMTCAYKYALRQALLIETGDDPDNFPSEGPPPNGKTADKRGATSPQGQKAREEHRPTNEPNTKPTNGNGGMSALDWREAVSGKLGFTGPDHVLATVRLLGYKSTPQGKEARIKAYKELKAYRGLRDMTGLAKDDALVALADEHEEEKEE